MTLFDQHIYWTDWNTRSIYRANKYDGSDQIVMIMNLPQRPMDIHVWSKSKQQQCINPCNQFNGGCSHICAPGKLLCLMIMLTVAELIVWWMLGLKITWEWLKYLFT